MLSGARAGELVGLRWKDIDLDRGVARLMNTKNGSNRPVPAILAHMSSGQNHSERALGTDLAR